jgi:hypothetical protein
MRFGAASYRVGHCLEKATNPPLAGGNLCRLAVEMRLINGICLPTPHRSDHNGKMSADLHRAEEVVSESASLIELIKMAVFRDSTGLQLALTLLVTSSESCERRISSVQTNLPSP